MLIKSKVTLAVIGLAGVMLVGAIAPAAAHKQGGGQHGKNNPPAPQNPGPFPKPLPPVTDTGGRFTPKPVAVRDHRTGPVVRDARADAPKVTDHRATGAGGVKVTDSGKARSRGSVPCLGNLCGAIKVAKSIKGFRP